jgi:glycosyltransferase involved in cell wall biosynthesis
MGEIPATATIIAHNESENIVHCIKSVQFFDEILVIDSGSTDDTVTLAEQAGARVIHNPWLGFGLQKQLAFDNATHDWVFSIDADERVSPRLKQSLIELFSQSSQSSQTPGTPPFNGYLINRCNHFMGQALRHGEGYPDWLLRLSNRTKAKWSEDPVHEKIQLAGEKGKLIGDLDHHTEGQIGSYLVKQNNYTTLQARSLFEKGKRASSWKLVASPMVRFLKFYFLRLGLLDGVPGFVHISIGCFNSFCKYAKLRELQKCKDS